MEETEIVINKIYGYLDVRSWLEYQDGKLVGMGSVTEHDMDGNIVSHKVEPTGISLRL